MCAYYMAQLYLTSFSSITKPIFIVLPFPHGHIVHTGGSWGPTPPAGTILRRQAEALHRRSLAGREAHLGALHTHTLNSMSNLAAILWKQGKLDEAGLRVFGVGGDLPGRFTKGIFLFGQGLRQYCWITFFGRNTSSGPPSTFHSCNRQNEHMAKLSNLSGEFLQMRPIDGYSINISI